MNLFKYSITITYMQQHYKQNLIILGQRVKTLRENTGESINSLVFKRGGLTSATWSRIENGLFDVKFNTLIKVASILGITLEELLKNLSFDYTIYEE